MTGSRRSSPISAGQLPLPAGPHPRQQQDTSTGSASTRARHGIVLLAWSIPLSGSTLYHLQRILGKPAAVSSCTTDSLSCLGPPLACHSSFFRLRSSKVYLALGILREPLPEKLGNFDDRRTGLDLTRTLWLPYRAPSRHTSNTLSAQVSKLQEVEHKRREQQQKVGRTRLEIATRACTTPCGTYSSISPPGSTNSLRPPSTRSSLPTTATHRPAFCRHLERTTISYCSHLLHTLGAACSRPDPSPPRMPACPAR